MAPKKSKHNVLPAGKQIRSKKIPCGQTSETQKLIHELQVHRIQLEKTVSLLRGTLESTADGILVVNNEGKEGKEFTIKIPKEAYFLGNQ